jgi:hypothetical protein
MGRHKKRWGIETTFRVQDEVKIKTAVFAVIALLNRLESVLLLISPKSIRGYSFDFMFDVAIILYERKRTTMLIKISAAFIIMQIKGKSL